MIPEPARTSQPAQKTQPAPEPARTNQPARRTQPATASYHWSIQLLKSKNWCPPDHGMLPTPQPLLGALPVATASMTQLVSMAAVELQKLQKCNRPLPPGEHGRVIYLPAAMSTNGMGM